MQLGQRPSDVADKLDELFPAGWEARAELNGDMQLFVAGANGRLELSGRVVRIGQQQVFFSNRPSLVSPNSTEPRVGNIEGQPTGEPRPPLRHADEILSDVYRDIETRFGTLAPDGVLAPLAPNASGIGKALRSEIAFGVPFITNAKHVATAGPLTGVLTLGDAQRVIAKLVKDRRLVDPQSGAFNTVYRLLDERHEPTGLLLRVPNDFRDRNVNVNEIRFTVAAGRLGIGPIVHSDQSFFLPNPITNGYSGTALILMEEVQGQNMKSLMAQRDELSDVRRVTIAGNLVKAIAAMHANGITYADTHGGNIIVTPDDQVKIIDYGMAAQLPKVIKRGGNWHTVDVFSMLQIANNLRPQNVDRAEWEARLQALYLSALNNQNSPANDIRMNAALGELRSSNANGPQ